MAIDCMLEAARRIAKEERDRTAEVEAVARHASAVVVGILLALLVGVHTGYLVVMVDMRWEEHKLTVRAVRKIVAQVAVAAVRQKVLAQVVLRERKCSMAAGIHLLLVMAFEMQQWQKMVFCSMSLPQQ